MKLLVSINITMLICINCLANFILHSAYTPIKELKVTENSILVCSDDSTIKRLEVLNSEYKYNVTCNGVIPSRNPVEEESFTAIFESKRTPENDKEPTIQKKVTINVKDKYRISSFNHGKK